MQHEESGYVTGPSRGCLLILGLMCWFWAAVLLLVAWLWGWL